MTNPSLKVPKVPTTQAAGNRQQAAVESVLRTGIGDGLIRQRLRFLEGWLTVHVRCGMWLE